MNIELAFLSVGVDPNIAISLATIIPSVEIDTINREQSIKDNELIILLYNAPDDFINSSLVVDSRH